MKVQIFILTLHLAYSLLKVTSPILNQFHNNELQYSLANFGDIPYGTIIKGNLKMDFASPTLCNSIEPLNNSNTILLTRRGQCSFVKKVLNGQKAGAKMVIISDNIIEDSSNIIMSDDGTGRNVHIPSIFINQTNGQILQRYLQHTNISISMRFDIKQTDTVNVTLFLNIQDRHSAVLVREIFQSFQSFGSKLNLDLSYYTIICPGCNPVECYGSNDYCIITANKFGGSVIRSQLIQYNIFLKNQYQWYKVYNQYDLQCSGQNSLTCLQNIIRQQGMDLTLMDSQNIVMGYPLQNWRKAAVITGVTTYPSVSVNGIKYQGSIDSEDVVEMICASLNNPPQGPCSQFGYWTFNSSSDYSKLQTAFWVIFIIIVIISLIFAGVYIYRRAVKKEITNQMSLKVTQMVTQYIKLASDQQRKTKNKEIQKSRQDL